MARLTLKMVDERVQALGGKAAYNRDFIFDLLLAYGRSSSTVTRLRSGNLNVAADPGREVALKNVVYFREIAATDHDSGVILHALESLRKESHVFRLYPRFVMVSDYQDLAAYDMKTGENLIIPIAEVGKHFAFFLPWAGMEKAQYVEEAHADVKAAEQMGKLFDQLLSLNPGFLGSEGGRHSLNVFFTRLLFCLFAEDTGIFPEQSFTYGVASHTQKDGSDLREYIETVFDYLDTPLTVERQPVFKAYPYVNGRLFTRDERLRVPDFDAQARKQLIAMGTLQWRDVNPDIFGSMFQAIVTPGKRSNLGQHYTSVPNILKTIDPLFMDDLRQQFDDGYESVKKLRFLLERISKIKIFDPACGSGNFLVIAYKELRKLEHMILGRLQELNHSLDREMFIHSHINIDHFYGIEIDDFASEVAILSLWIAKHQMNREFKELFSIDLPLIPLKETGRIVAANANRIDWQEVCPNNGVEEIYLIGNPPYVGSSMQSKEQKADYEFVFKDGKIPRKLDFIGLWFIQGAKYIQSSKACLAFVSTNSVTQGAQVAMLFPFIFEYGVEIGFAHTTFKWSNNAKFNAGVSVIVLSLRARNTNPKYIFIDNIRASVNNISPYLVDSKDVIVSARSKPLFDLPSISYGSKPTDGGHLILSAEETKTALENFPDSIEFIKRFCGSDDYINGKIRYCLLINENLLNDAKQFPYVEQRLKHVSEARLNSPKELTRNSASTPHLFEFCAYKPTDAIIVPSVSSERREYVPIGYVGPETVISNAAFAIYDAEPWLFSLLTSKMHMAWLGRVGGKLKTDYRYSNTLVYNTFPVPPLNQNTKTELNRLALRVLDVREYYCEYTLAQLYDPDEMPQLLREAHANIDVYVDSLYRFKPFESDEERLTVLFDMYEKAIAAETLELEQKKKTRRKKKHER